MSKVLVCGYMYVCCCEQASGGSLKRARSKAVCLKCNWAGSKGRLSLEVLVSWHVYSGDRGCGTCGVTFCSGLHNQQPQNNTIEHGFTTCMSFTTP